MLKLIGVDSSFKAPSFIDQPVINANDFRGEAFGVLARANQAALEAQKNRIINQASTDLALTQQQEVGVSSNRGYATSRSGGGGYSSGGGGKVFDPNMDVSEREKWEFEKQQKLANYQLDRAKYEHSATNDDRRLELDVAKYDRGIYEDNRDFSFKAGTDQRDFEYKVEKDALDYQTGRDDEMFNRNLESSKFNYAVEKDTQDRNDRIYEKQKQEFQAQQYAMAQQEVQELVLASEGLMRSGGGLEAIRGGLSSILQKYPGIAPDKQAELIQGVYATPQRVNRQQIEKTEQKIDEVQQFQRNTVLQAKRIELQGLTAGLKTATGATRQTLLARLDQKLGQFAATDTDPLTKAMVLSHLYEEVASKGEVGADVQQKLLDYASYTRDVSKLFMQRNKMSPSQYALRESMLQQKYSVTGQRLDDTNFDNKKALETLRTTSDLRELRTRNAIDSKFGLGASRAAIAELAKANMNPAQIASLKAMSERYGRPPGLEQAIKLAEDGYNHRQKAVEVQMKLSNLEKEQAMLQSSDAKTVLDMLEGGKQQDMQSLITTGMLINANPKLAQALQQNKPIPPEVRAQIQSTWSQQRQRIVNEINIQKRLISTEYQMERDYLQSYYNKDDFAALENVRNQIPQLRSQMNTSVGVQRSGALGTGTTSDGSGLPQQVQPPTLGDMRDAPSYHRGAVQGAPSQFMQRGTTQSVWNNQNSEWARKALQNLPPAQGETWRLPNYDKYTKGAQR